MEYTAFFYEVDGQVCRKYLDIKTSGLPGAYQPDIVFICLNPGSCATTLFDEPIQVNPDPTIRQLSSLIGHHDIKFIKLLNLSDFKEPKSHLLFDTLKNRDFEKYSLFSPARHNELEQILQPGSKVVTAWGVNPRNKVLVKMALAFLQKTQIPILNPELPSYHPLPHGIKRRQWVVDMKTLLSRHFS